MFLNRGSQLTLHIVIGTWRSKLILFCQVFTLIHTLWNYPKLRISFVVSDYALNHKESGEITRTPHAKAAARLKGRA